MWSFTTASHKRMLRAFVQRLKRWEERPFCCRQILRIRRQVSNDHPAHSGAWPFVWPVCNNAAVFAPLDWEGTRLEDWNQHLMINLTAPFFAQPGVCTGAAPRESGRIINLLDWRGLRPGPDHLPYTISKSALVALTRSLAIALAPQINVNGLALGAILPPSEGKIAPKYSRQSPCRAVGQPGRSRPGADFSAGWAAYVTGEILHVDGGRHLL